VVLLVPLVLPLQVLLLVLPPGEAVPQLLLLLSVTCE
jgi:hypothetical protein